MASAALHIAFPNRLAVARVAALAIAAALLALAATSLLAARTDHARDVSAQRQARSAEAAMESFYARNHSYNADSVALRALRPELAGARLLAVHGAGETYAVSIASSASGDSAFTVRRAADGTVTRTDSSGKRW